MLFSLDNDIHPYVRLIGRVRYASEWKHFDRTLPEFVLYLMIDGKMVIGENSRQYTLSGGDYLLLEPGLPHRGIEAHLCEYYYIHFRHSGLKQTTENEDRLIHESFTKRCNSLQSYGLAETMPTDTITYIPKTGSLSKNSLCTQYIEMGITEYTKKLEQYRPSLANMISLFLLELSREYVTQLYSSKAGSKYTRVMGKTIELIRFINANYNSKITGKTIEDAFHMSFDYLNRTFKTIYGKTIFSYLTQVRVNQARSLIGHTDLSVSEIASMIGFEDSSNFTKYFKQHTGTTPSQYWRLSHQDKAEVNMSGEKEDNP